MDYGSINLRSGKKLPRLPAIFLKIHDELTLIGLTQYRFSLARRQRQCESFWLRRRNDAGAVLRKSSLRYTHVCA